VGPRDVALYTVSRQNLPLVITERGTIDAQLETDIRCEVTTSSHTYNGPSSTPIIYMVPDGAEVTEGDLLVELDSSIIEDHLYQHTLRYHAAVGREIRYRAIYENQKIQNEARLDNAQLELDLARLRLEMYCDQEVGSRKLEHDEITRSILEQRASLALARTEERGTEQLFELGYTGKSQMETARFKRLLAENKLSSYLSRQRQLKQFDQKKELLSLQGAVDRAQWGLEQVIADNKMELIEAETNMDEAIAYREREEERVKSLKLEVERCHIYAPHDGTVAYERDYRSGLPEYREGSRVYRMQRIMSLPNLAQMQVNTTIHEGSLDQVVTGMPVTVRVEAYPNETYTGTVHEISPIPSSLRVGYFTTRVKTFKTTVLIDGEVNTLRPGMTATVEIEVDPIQDAIAVPVEAVVEGDDGYWCYVETSRDLEKRPVVLGRSNDRFVQVHTGLQEGDRVVLEPSVINQANPSLEKQISPTNGMPEPPATTRQPDGKLAASEARSDSE
jgi:HlyD family secretion protein